ncbi:hypothetical protein ACFVZD_47350 [Streptomyces sp. NPDC058287]|uniref:hypothetical protein n=1 Tax=unclassified Streptomyces TaxID=2593676 RepID=UPI0036EF1571
MDLYANITELELKESGLDRCGFSHATNAHIQVNEKLCLADGSFGYPSEPAQAAGGSDALSPPVAEACRTAVEPWPDLMTGVLAPRLTVHDVVDRSRSLRPAS